MNKYNPPEDEHTAGEIIALIRLRDEEKQQKKLKRKYDKLQKEHETLKRKYDKLQAQHKALNEIFDELYLLKKTKEVSKKIKDSVKR